ncbi:hypothetical protein TRAPUB_13885 [Trametes pubescens]|uniref:BTB domain-containing protein n=1 Tax=Trametes pubescens TaxID=154538 RepID=A0A1M2VQ32_TRAPU|nr:hypothetical protein TRAPUB_13885 [Trametes pubescens]
MNDQDVPAQSTIVSISTTFHPTANILPIPTDLVLISSDKVLFYVHTTQVLGVSTNHFNDTILPQLLGDLKSGEVEGGVHNPITHVPESSAVLNVILHSSYGVPCEQYKPTLNVLITAVDAMPSYGLSPKALVVPATSLYSLILAQAPIHPLHVYALASRHDLYELAKPVSSFLLSFSLDTLMGDFVSLIAPVYLKKIYVLYSTRLDALKRLLYLPPHIHPSTPECDFAEQKKLARAWALATAYLAWEATAAYRHLCLAVVRPRPVFANGNSGNKFVRALEELL